MNLRPLLYLSLLPLAFGCTKAPDWTLVYREAVPASAPWRFGDIAGYYPSLEQCLLKGKGMQHLGKGESRCGSHCELVDDDKLAPQDRVLRCDWQEAENAL
ncbi:hypothetical protein [Shewanella cyperi]|uniref:Lipoprotein n=1 Tax=Shewanella cyperi TaxID=2814292 RepID=A0A974XML9_9GAMM|nr:hypothetical protein [Shewanella cyperi]QSX29831.1 hypothetical protein JYB88_16860 [Shewanella cyperi]QSX40615.1 hypothetical protein JYB84_16955 [Shewanella cyperi]